MDITCTATLRPELLERTLTSHIKNLFGESYIKYFRLIINIDLIGHDETDSDRDYRLNKIFDLLQSIKFRDLKINVSESPSFANAWFWVMGKVESDLFFNLEEDWELAIPINFQKMKMLMTSDESLVHLRLSQFKSEDQSLKNWNKFLFWNGAYFQVKDEEKGSIGWCGHPSLNSTLFIKQCMKYMRPDINPEKQIKHHYDGIRQLIEKSRFGSFHPRNTEPAEIDIGRNWMIEKGFAKAGNKAFFDTWEKTERGNK